MIVAYVCLFLLDTLISLDETHCTTCLWYQDYQHVYSLWE